MRAALLAWFDVHGRALDFRASASPYGILVGEVMAQQTQVRRVEPAWHAFMARYPSPESLASASLGDVLRAWAGMGYNRRALNLQRAAAHVVRDHGGHVPAALAELERLPGVGAYTARAVAAIAFGMPVGAVDTNVRRVLMRVLAREGSAPRFGITSRAVRGSGAVHASGAAELQRVADQLVDPDRPADWTHALMDVGATICRPARTDCSRCPLRSWCASEQLATARPTRPAPHRSPRSSPSPRFAATSRWLRGRLMARLREAPDGGWVELTGPLGVHSAKRVDEALAALARESLVERDGAGRVRLPVVPARLARIGAP
jgi:A/G-specific adenine glycosylase